MAPNKNIFDDVSDSIRQEIKSFRKDAGKSKTPKRGQGDRRKNRKSDPLAAFMKQNNIQKQFLRMGAGLDQ